MLFALEGRMDRRQSSRIPFKAPAFVMQDNKPVVSQTQDISDHGVFINTRCTYNEGEKTFVSIYFLEGKITLSMTVPCTVARSTDSGIGCTSPQLDPETLLFISNLLHSQKGDSPKFMQSFYGFMNEHDFHAKN